MSAYTNPGPGVFAISMKIKIITASLMACLSMSAKAENDTVALSDTESKLRNKSEPVQWLPHSVTVLTKDDVEETFRRDIEDLESLVPGMIVDRMNTTPRGAAIAIRGLGSSGASKAFDPAVAVNIDGVYIGTHTSRLQVLFDFERVEVIRGPNTFEANPNIAGTINLERARPTGELDVDVRASVGIDERREADVVVNAPAIGGVSAKLGIYRKDSGGAYMKNVFNDRDENTEDYSLISTTIAWDLDDLFEATYTFDSERSEETTPALLNVSAPTDLLCSTTSNTNFPNCRRGVGNPELDSLRTTAQNFLNDRELDGDYHTLKVTFTAFDHDFISVTGHRSTDETSNLDFDASNADFYHVSQDQSWEQFSQELTVLGSMGERLSYSGGVYLLESEYDIFQQELHILKQLGDAGFTEGHAAGEIQELTSSQETSMVSVFAHAEYLLNDQWTADLGARWTEVDRDFSHSPSRIRLGNNVSPLRTLLDGEETSKEFLISGGLAYRVDEEALIFFRYSEGFLPGGFDENAMSAASGNSYGSETSRTGEIGLKSDWWDDQLRVNLTYYKTELNNKVERFDSVVASGNIESILDNVAEVEISGWELEVESTPLDNLQLRTSLSHINSDYNQYNVADITGASTIINLSNLTPARAPADNLFMSAKYSLRLGPGTLHAYAGYRLYSDYQTNPLLPEADVKNWSSWDLSFTYAYKQWQFRLFSNNVKNKEYIQNVQNITQTAILPVNAGATSVPSLITFAEYNQPRYTGLEITFRPNF